MPTPETITADWLTDRLRAAGHADARVAGFDATRIGTGQLGACYRYRLDLAAGGPDVPTGLVAKFSSDDPASRATGVLLHTFLKEVRFYQELQARVRIPTPRCYHAEIEGEGPDFVLLLEDLAPAQPGDQLAGCPVDVAEAAVAALVGLHAPTWCDRSLVGLDFLGAPDAARARLVQDLYRANLAGFLVRFGPSLGADERRLYERVGDRAELVLQPLVEPFALVHVDYRLDNLLVDRRAGRPRVTVVDWQTVSLGGPMRDVAYFLGAGLLADDRRRHEERLVRAYHAALVEAGVAGYGWDACWQDHRRGSFAGMVMTVIASMLVQRTARGDEMFTAMARRHARHALDLGADDLLG